MGNLDIDRMDRGAARWAVRGDLLFWGVVGPVVAIFATHLGPTWGVPTQWLVIGGLAIAGLAVLGLVLLRRPGSISKPVARMFGVGNLVIAPLAVAAGAFDWLGLTSAGDLAVAIAGGVALALGVWQLASSN